MRYYSPWNILLSQPSLSIEQTLTKGRWNRECMLRAYTEWSANEKWYKKPKQELKLSLNPKCRQNDLHKVVYGTPPCSEVLPVEINRVWFHNFFFPKFVTKRVAQWYESVSHDNESLWDLYNFYFSKLFKTYFLVNTYL